MIGYKCSIYYNNRFCLRLFAVLKTRVKNNLYKNNCNKPKTMD